MQRVYQFRNITYGESNFNYQFMYQVYLVTVILYAEDGTVGLGWYEIGQMISTNDGTDFVYTGNKDIWPGNHDGTPPQ